MVGLAVMMFVGMIVYGNEIFGWTPSMLQAVQIPLFLSFLLGIVSGYKIKG
jgi:hypothetical protein